MKRQSSAAKAITALLCILFCLTLAGCRSTAGTDHDQIVRTAIDLAQSYSARGEHDKALDVYDRALEQADDYRLYYNKAIILSESGRNVEAAILCAESFGKYNHIMAFKKAQAINLSIAGDDQGAVSCYNEMLTLNPYDVETRCRLIETLIATGDTENAYQHALTLWRQGYRDKTTASYLFALHPELWANVYRSVT